MCKMSLGAPQKQMHLCSLLQPILCRLWIHIMLCKLHLVSLYTVPAWKEGHELLVAKAQDVQDYASLLDPTHFVLLHTIKLLLVLQELLCVSYAHHKKMNVVP